MKTFLTYSLNWDKTVYIRGEWVLYYMVLYYICVLLLIWPVWDEMNDRQHSVLLPWLGSLSFCVSEYCVVIFVSHYLIYDILLTRLKLSMRFNIKVDENPNKETCFGWCLMSAQFGPRSQTCRPAGGAVSSLLLVYTRPYALDVTF